MRSSASNEPADGNATRIASERGVDLQPHRATHIGEITIDDGDLFIAFEPSQADALRRMVELSGTDAQVTLMGFWGATRWLAYIQDPYGLSDVYFRRCFSRIESSVDGLLAAHAAARRRATEKAE